MNIHVCKKAERSDYFSICKKGFQEETKGAVNQRRTDNATHVI